jgi:hypothetical protein
MLTSKKQVVAALSKILPCYYELFCDSKTQMPCITYIENNNYSEQTGDTLGYSSIEYTIKVWATEITDIELYSAQADKAMREMGFKRISANELTVENQIERVLTYSALGLEQF